MKVANAIKQMETFKSRGIGWLESLTKEELNNMILVANKQYHAFLENNTPLTLTDHEFDIVKEYLEKKHPDATALKEIGSEVVHSKQKVELPVNMPSMDKIKPDTDALDSWKKKYRGPYVLSCKLDGVSGLYYTMNNQTRLYTRGDGTIGQDITGVLNYIHLPQIPNVIIRGEFIIKKKEFETHYSKTASNIRNMVAGIINQKKHDPTKTKSVDFVAYEVIEPVLSPSQQMAFLKENHFNTVQHETTKMPTTTPITAPITTHTTITNETLSNTLVKWRAEYEYEIDGVIVANDAIYERTSTNPKHAFAFKMVISDQLAETQVTDVIWTPSKDGYLKPRVRVNPVKINGVKIEYVTGFNGQYISKNKIGIGAVIQLVRSGDVIPYIKSVVVPAETAKMPDVPYTWTESNIDILLSNTCHCLCNIDQRTFGTTRDHHIDIVSVVVPLTQVFPSPEAAIGLQPSFAVLTDDIKQQTSTKITAAVKKAGLALLSKAFMQVPNHRTHIKPQLVPSEIAWYMVLRVKPFALRRCSWRSTSESLREKSGA